MRPLNHDIPQWKLALFALILLLGVAQILLPLFMQARGRAAEGHRKPARLLRVGQSTTPV